MIKINYNIQELYQIQSNQKFLNFMCIFVASVFFIKLVVINQYWKLKIRMWLVTIHWAHVLQDAMRQTLMKILRYFLPSHWIKFKSQLNLYNGLKIYSMAPRKNRNQLIKFTLCIVLKFIHLFPKK